MSVKKFVQISKPVIDANIDVSNLPIKINTYYDNYNYTIETILTKTEIPVEQSESKQSATAKADGVKIRIVNVVCCYRLHCHVRLKDLGRECVNCVYCADKNVVKMALRKPNCMANVWSSGKVVIMGCKTEEESHLAARRIARRIQKCRHPKTKIKGYRITNMMGRCEMPFGIRLDHMASESPLYQYEPEIDAALHAKFPVLNTSVNVNSDGKICIFSASRVKMVQALTEIHPVCWKHRIRTEESAGEEDDEEEEREESGSSEDEKTGKSKVSPDENQQLQSCDVVALDASRDVIVSAVSSNELMNLNDIINRHIGELDFLKDIA